MYVIDYLNSCRVPFASLLHQPMFSATRRAGTMHVPGSRVAKAVLVRTGDSFTIALLSSTRRIDLERLGEAVGCSSPPIRLATDGELTELFPDCEAGVVPPLGRLYGLRTVVDAQLAEEPELVIGGNQRHEGMRISFADFKNVAEPIHASFSLPTAEPVQRSPYLAGDRVAG